MKVTLISTDADIWSFGIRTLSSVLRDAGHSPRLLFLPSDSPQYGPEVLEQIHGLTRDSGLVGISSLSRGSRRAQQVCTYLRSCGQFVVWGGLHATLNPTECAAAAGLVCRGEGEQAIVELAEALGAGRDWRSLRNLGYLQRGAMVLNPMHPAVANLDRLPFPDFERLDEFHLMGDTLVSAPRPAEGLPKAQALTIGSRGCAFHCTYCCNRPLKELYTGNGIYIRKMSPARYVQQIAALHRGHFRNATDFFLVDEDLFMRSVSEIREFAALYREKIGIPFECMGSPPRITEEKLSLLADAGLWRLRVGIESGSERTKREVYDRRISNQAVLQAARVIAARRDVVAAYFFISGNPYEGPRDLLDTLQLMERLPYPYYAQVFNLVFFPGSALYRKAVADGIIAGPDDCGAELHYRAGFQYGAHSWKQRNVYLNLLIFLTEGKATRYRLGFVPRFLLPWLTHSLVIRWVDAWPFISRSLVALHSVLLSWRSRVGAVVKGLMDDPAGVYDVTRYFRKLARRVFTKPCALADP